MLPLLLIPLALGWVLSRRYLARPYLHTVLAESGALAIVTTLIGVNFFYRQTTLSTAIGATLSLQAVALVVLLLLRRGAPAPFQKLPPRCDWLLAALSLVVLLYCNAQQIANPDDDTWIHSPLQGLMRAGNFPPFNPFFSDIPMNGHYGRNLSIITLSALSGADVFLSQHVFTSAVQMLTLWLFFAAVLRCTKSYKAAFLAVVFVFFGINAGGRGGLMDTMQNNNTLVHMYLALLLGLVCDVWREGRRTCAVLAGLTLGSYAIVYETHFGLVFFTILGVTPILLARKVIDLKRSGLAGLVLALALPLAFTQGGPLTDLLSRKVEGRGHSQAEQLSKGMQNQAQVVKVGFPKEQLFQILLETGEYQRISHIYAMDTPLRVLYEPATDRGYAYIWSWDVLRIHFLPLYLLPFSFWVLWKRASLPGLFMGAFGVIAYLTPALVHFGPIYESEYYRWEFAASLGFAACLGLALAHWLDSRAESKSTGLLFRPSEILITRSGRRFLLVLFLTTLNSLPALSYLSGRLGAAFQEGPSAWLYFPSTATWLQKHPVLRFNLIDIKAAQWLSERVDPGDRLLTNFQEENNFSILYESTLTGISGARCVGHALPLEDEKIGTTPFRRSPAATLFWETYRPEPLRQLQVDWLFYAARQGEELPPLPGATLQKREVLANDMRLVYHIDQSKLTGPLPYVEDPPQVEAQAPRTSEVLRGGRLANLKLDFQGEPEARLAGSVEISTQRKSDGFVSPASENLHLDIDQPFSPQGDLTVELPFVPPHEEGEYVLRLRWTPAEGGPEFTIPEGEITVKFASLLEKISVPAVHWEREQPWPARTLLRPEVELSLPEELPNPSDVLACWAFYSEEHQRFDLLPGVNLRRISLNRTLKGLPAITPERPGEYRLALYLSAGQGHLCRLPVTRVTIR